MSLYQEGEGKPSLVPPLFIASWKPPKPPFYLHFSAPPLPEQGGSGAGRAPSSSKHFSEPRRQWRHHLNLWKPEP